MLLRGELVRTGPPFVPCEGGLLWEVVLCRDGPREAAKRPPAMPAVRPILELVPYDLELLPELELLLELELLREEELLWEDELLCEEELLRDELLWDDELLLLGGIMLFSLNKL